MLGAGLSDEEFLLRATMPGGLVDAMRASAPAARHYDPATRPVLELLYRLLARRDLDEITWRSPASGWRCGAMEPGRAHESGK